MIIWLPLLVSIIGLIIYLATENPKASHIGDTMFWTGLLVTLFMIAGKTVEVLR